MKLTLILLAACSLCLTACNTTRKPQPGGSTAKLQTNITNVRSNIQQANASTDRLSDLGKANRNGASRIDSKAMKALKFFNYKKGELE